MVDCINYFIIWFCWAMSFQLAVKFAKIFEQKCKSNWKVQANAPLPDTCQFYTGRPNVNKKIHVLSQVLLSKGKTL